MASQAMRAPADVSGTPVQRAACAQYQRKANAAHAARPAPGALAPAYALRPSARPLFLAFLAFLTFLGCASIQHVAYAHVEAPVSSLDAAVQAGEDGAGIWDIHHADVSPYEDLAVADSEGPEEDAHFDTPAVACSFTLSAIPALAGPASYIAHPTWVEQRRVSSANPRGPPALRG